MVKEKLVEEIKNCEKLLIGIGEEWRSQEAVDIQALYDKLSDLIQGKDYFIVTTVTDGEIRKSSLDQKRIVAPCGNVTWRL